MIVLPRLMCRVLHTVFRRLGRSRSAPELSIELLAGRSGVTVQAVTPEVTLRHHTSGRCAEDRLQVPLIALIECGGDDESRVTFRAVRDRIEAKWRDRGTPVVREYRLTGRTLPAPTPPGRFTPLRPEFLAAMDAAGSVVSRDAESRFVLNRIQLRGGPGEIVASDSKQLLLQSGFTFPWTGNVLVPRSDVVAALAGLKPATVSAARSATHVWIASGPWSLALTIDASGKFPDVGPLLTRAAKHGAELTLDPGDRDRLLREVPKLAGGNEDHRPVILDLVGPIVRVTGTGDAKAAITLVNSKVQGKRLRMSCDRTFLLTALKFGLLRMTAATAEQPLVWRDATRTYLFLPLSDGSGSRHTTPRRSQGVTRTKESTKPAEASEPRSEWTSQRPKVSPAGPVGGRTPPRPKAAPPKRGRPASKTKPIKTRSTIGGFWSRLRGLFRGRTRPSG